MYTRNYIKIIKINKLQKIQNMNYVIYTHYKTTFELFEKFQFFPNKCPKVRKCFGIVGLFCIINHYFEYRIRILCIKVLCGNIG